MNVLVMWRNTIVARYEYKILNALLDSYESSLLSRGENKVSIHIQYVFSKKNLPSYFDESSLDYEDIHTCVKQLEKKGFLSIVWKQGKQDYIIEKVLLNTDALYDVYKYLKRVPKSENEKNMLALLGELRKKYNSPIAIRFMDYLMTRIREGKTVKEYIDLADSGQIENLIKALFFIETNNESCYIREFSIRYFHDSKIFENMTGKISKVWKKFGVDNEFEHIESVLAEHLIYSTPNYVYIKGSVILELNQQRIDLESLSQGMGLSGEDISLLSVFGKTETKKVITIENLTTFFRWKEKDSIIIYLGGYHNSLRRWLLKMIYEQMPNVEYFHFGDIDVGGFEIYEDLCRKTGIPFRIYHMGVDELEKNKIYAKNLTENDKKRLDNLIQYASENERVYVDVLHYMKEHSVKLEQECVGLDKK